MTLPDDVLDDVRGLIERTCERQGVGDVQAVQLVGLALARIVGESVRSDVEALLVRRGPRRR